VDRRASSFSSSSSSSSGERFVDLLIETVKTTEGAVILVEMSVHFNALAGNCCKSTESTPMKNILVVGAGHIGAMIAELLAATGDYRGHVSDAAERALGAIARKPNIDTLLASAGDSAVLAQALSAATRHQRRAILGHRCDRRGGTRCGRPLPRSDEDVATTRRVASCRTPRRRR